MNNTKINIARLEFLISKISSHKNWCYSNTNNPTYSFVIRCILNIQVKLAKELLSAIQNKNYFIANILVNSMCDALIQLLWMSIDKENRASMYKKYAAISALKYLSEVDRTEVLEIMKNDLGFKCFLKKSDKEISLNKYDYVQDWFKFENKSMTRFDMVKEWINHTKIQKNHIDYTFLERIYDFYDITCAYKHFSPHKIISTFDHTSYKFKESYKDVKRSCYIAALALDTTVYLVNETQLDKLDI